MKITKKQLHKIIKEELKEVGIPLMSTGLGVPGSSREKADPHTEAFNNLKDYVKNKYSKDGKLLDLLETAEELMAEFESDIMDPSTELGQRVKQAHKTEEDSLEQ